MKRRPAQPRVRLDRVTTLVEGTRNWCISNKFGSATFCDFGDRQVYVDCLTIDEGFRGKGHGSAFLLAIEAYARKHGFKWVMLQAGHPDSNYRLRRWYKARGCQSLPHTGGLLRHKKL